MSYQVCLWYGELALFLSLVHLQDFAMVTVVRLVVLLKQKRNEHRGGRDFVFMIVAGSQIVLFRPGYQVKLHSLWFHYMDELPLNKHPERKALHNRYSRVAKVASVWFMSQCEHTESISIPVWVPSVGSSEIQWIDNVTSLCTDRSATCSL